MVSVVNFKSSTVNLVSYLFFWSSRRRLNVLKTRSPRGNATYDGMEWKLCSGVRPRCCGVIPSLVYVCGACYCWPKAAAVDQSSPSDENGSIELIWSQICFLLGRALDGPLLPESVTGGLGRWRDWLEPRGLINYQRMGCKLITFSLHKCPGQLGCCCCFLTWADSQVFFGVKHAVSKTQRHSFMYPFKVLLELKGGRAPHHQFFRRSIIPRRTGGGQTLKLTRLFMVSVS